MHSKAQASNLFRGLKWILSLDLIFFKVQIYIGIVRI